MSETKTPKKYKTIFFFLLLSIIFIFVNFPASYHVNYGQSVGLLTPETTTGAFFGITFSTAINDGVSDSGIIFMSYILNFVTAFIIIFLFEKFIFKKKVEK